MSDETELSRVRWFDEKRRCILIRSNGVSDIWYYADGEKTVGPFGLSDLALKLAKLPDAKNTYVWSENMTDWMRADDVAELRRHFVKPPPLVKPPVKAEEKKSEGGWFKKGAIGAVTLIATLIAAAIGGVIGRQGVQAITKPSPATIQSQIEAGQEKALPQMRAELPKKVDELTTMVAVDARGGTVFYSYRIEADRSEYKDVNFVGEMRKLIKGSACKETGYVNSLHYGAKYQYSYVDKNGQSIGALVIDKADCPKNE